MLKSQNTIAVQINDRASDRNTMVERMFLIKPFCSKFYFYRNFNLLGDRLVRKDLCALGPV